MATATSNPPFDSRITALHGLSEAVDTVNIHDHLSLAFFQNLSRGSIVEYTAKKQKRKRGAYRCNFLYNPSTVSVNHSVDMSNLVYSDYNRPKDSIGTYNTPLNASASFTLLFDRTYEMTDLKYVGKAVQRRGVLEDVDSLYRITGINSKQEYNVTEGDFRPEGTPRFVKGPMQMNPCHFYFGDGASSALALFGFIQSLGIQYTHWNQFMVPQRTAIQIGVTLLPEQTG